jgi:transposase InsO family protein
VLSQYPVDLIQTDVTIKRAHPHWGPANVRVELSHQSQQDSPALPSLSRLSVLFKQHCPEAVQPRKPREQPKCLPTSLHVHQRWEVDAVEKIVLRAGQFASVLEIREPVGALMILSRAFATTIIAGRTWRKLTLEELRQAMRLAFSVWGRPQEIQTDNESIFAGVHKADFPTLYTLWLVGLGIQHLFSRAGQPTDQAHVERNHRTQADMSWKDAEYDGPEELQQVLDQSCQRYNRELPVHAGQCRGQPPLCAAPDAAYTGRPYDPALEYELFDLAAVDQFLVTQGPWIRKADSNGVVWLGSYKYYLTRVHKNQFVSIHYLAETRSFSFVIERDEAVVTLPALGLSKTDLTGLFPVQIPALFQYPLPLVGV